jgi:phosphotransferase system  glucose/maltose/N-acetylglucosamine-specific IIC component
VINEVKWGFINVPPGQEDTKRRSSRKDISKRYREIFRVLCVCVMDLLSINSHHSLSHLLNCILSPAAGSRDTWWWFFFFSVVISLCLVFIIIVYIQAKKKNIRRSTAEENR